MRKRLYMHYDQKNGFVRFSIPQGSTTTDINTLIWIYDIKEDRMFTDSYEVTVWGDADQQVTTALIWSAATASWDDIQGSWESKESTFGAEAVMHANSSGHVMVHDASIYTQNDGDGANVPGWSYDTHDRSYGGIRAINTMERLAIEYHNVAETGVTFTVHGEGQGSSGVTESENVTIGAGAVPDIDSRKAYFRTAGLNLSWKAAGTHPALIRGFEWEVWDEGVEPRE